MEGGGRVGNSCARIATRAVGVSRLVSLRARDFGMGAGCDRGYRLLLGMA